MSNVMNKHIKESPCGQKTFSKLTEEIEKLKKENALLKVDSDEYVKVKELYFEANEEIDDLKKEIKEYEAESLKSMKEQMSLSSNGMKLDGEIEKLKKENERLSNILENHTKYIDFMEEVCDDVNGKFCCGTGSRPPKYDITMDYIEERLKKKKNHDVQFWGFFRLIKHLKEENEKLKKDLDMVCEGEAYSHTNIKGEIEKVWGVIKKLKSTNECNHKLIECRGEEISKSHIDIINLTNEIEKLKEKEYQNQYYLDYIHVLGDAAAHVFRYSYLPSVGAKWNEEEEKVEEDDSDL